MLYINGEWIDTEEKLEVINPATGEVVDSVSVCTGDETNDAILAAKNAFNLWSRKTATERYNLLKVVANVIRSRSEQIAKVITQEMGKPLKEANAEISLAIDYIDWYAEEGRRIYGEIIPSSSESKRLMVMRQPIGVVGAITPWNFPIAMITRKIAPALAAGCTVVLKPASSTPLTAIEVFKAFHDAGFPNGTVNLLHGSSKKIVGTMMESPDVRKITFTGSTEVGKQLVKKSAKTMKKVSMELGGHAPFIVLPDADLNQAAEATVISKFRNAGQTCVCTNRVYVHEEVYEEYSNILTDKIKSLRVGNGMDPEVNIGPLIDEKAIEKVKDHVNDAVEKGASVLTGGKRIIKDDYINGYFFEPTLLGDAHHNMKIAQEETFGPVIPLFSFKSEDEIIQKANDTQYGLAAYIFTNDVSKVYKISESLDFGVIGVNDPLPTVAQAPFGGLKESGIGREGGKQGIEAFLEYKYLSIQLKE